MCGGAGERSNFLHICRMKKWIPNLITLLNLLMGCIAALYAFNQDLLTAGFFVGLGIFFDFFDGLAARLLKVSSDLGTQLDSLADMVTSGLVPGIAMYVMIYNSVGLDAYDDQFRTITEVDKQWLWQHILPFFGFLITLGSCYRLAKFNIDTRQTDSFIGLPTPANAILIISIGVLLQQEMLGDFESIVGNVYFLIGLCILSCYLLNAELPLFALKFKNFGWKGNEVRWIFLLSSLLMLIFLKLIAVPLIIVLYVLMSVGVNVVRKD